MGKLVNQAELANIFGVSHVTVRDWEREGMPAKSKGRRGVAAEYDTEECINWKIGAELGEMRDPDDKTLDIEKERAQLIKAQREGHEIKNSVMRRDLVPAPAMVSAWSAHITAAKSKLRSIKAKLKTRIPRLTQKEIAIIDGFINNACNELKDDVLPGIEESLRALDESLGDSASSEGE